jgi:hypothetical protein
MKPITKIYSFQCSALQQYTGYKAADLRDCVIVLHDLYLGRRGGSLQVVRAKYKQHKVFYKKCDLTYYFPKLRNEKPDWSAFALTVQICVKPSLPSRATSSFVFVIGRFIEQS